MTQTYNDAVPASTRDALEDLTAIRNNFAALKSCFSGSTAPPNPVAGMWWYDTTANILKLRNEANSAWLNVYDFANQRAPLALLATNCSRTVAAGTGIAVSGSLNGGNVTVGIASRGVGANQLADAAVTLIKLSGYTAGSTYLIFSADNEVTVSPTGSYIKAKEIVLDKGGTLRIAFDLRSPTGVGYVYGRVYRNGTAVGSTRQTNGTWQTYTQDISGWSPGDLLQIYVNTYTSSAPVLRNLRLYSGTWPTLRVTQG